MLEMTLEKEREEPLGKTVLSQEKKTENQIP